MFKSNEGQRGPDQMGGGVLVAWPQLERIPEIVFQSRDCANYACTLYLIYKTAS